MQTADCLYEVQSSSIEEVKERIMRQTMEALLFEDIIAAAQNGRQWTFTGRSSEGSAVRYSLTADKKWSFGRVKIEKNSIKREGKACSDLYVFLEEVIQNQLEGALTAQFIRELLETLAKDNQSRAFQPDRIPEEDKHYEALESHMTDGHPYHPSYKSRIGFSLADNFAYGPEFNREIAVQWVAVNGRMADIAVSAGNSLDELYKHHLTDEDRNTFVKVLEQKGSRDKKYVLLPVHPWQLEHQIGSVFAGQLADKDIVVLGPSAGAYRAQQSIRSLSHRGNADAAYIKFALSITNTSTSRILAHHTTQNAPLISDWLNRIIGHDELLKKERFRILREVMGVSFRYDGLPPIQYRQAYGSLGAIFRENVSAYLEAGEQAWPLNALLLTQKNGVPFIREAIGQYGVEKWSDALIRTVTLPIIHLLYAHGIALESHAQNIILVVENHFPKRIIVKDLHDGVRYTPDTLSRPEWAPELNPEPETHRKFNRYSFIQAEHASEVRDYTYDAFFFICMTDICFALEKFGLIENDFWRKCAETIADYQKEHPEYKERFGLFDLFSGDALIEEMTKRRIYGDGELYFRKVNNPLSAARDLLQ